MEIKHKNLIIVILIICFGSLIYRYNTLHKENEYLRNEISGLQAEIEELQGDLYYLQYDSMMIEEPNRGVERTEIPMLGDSPIKTYMDYRKITNVSSPQYQYIYNSGEVYICDDGFIRTVDGKDYIGVALGSYFGDIGNRYIFTLDTGVELRVIKIEEKADIHTDSNGYQHKSDGSIIEFVVDTEKMSYAKEENGHIYSGNFNNNEWLKGKIIRIEKVDV